MAERNPLTCSHFKAFKSLKAYKYFYDGYVKNVWVFECPVDNDLNLRVLYFRAFVYH